jgi:hypothetical protein
MNTASTWQRCAKAQRLRQRYAVMQISQDETACNLTERGAQHPDAAVTPPRDAEHHTLAPAPMMKKTLLPCSVAN